MNTTKTAERGDFTLPIGPLHVALEEPMYFRVSVEGEHVRHVDITAGHVHRGMEALACKRNFFQNIVLTDVGHQLTRAAGDAAGPMETELDQRLSRAERLMLIEFSSRLRERRTLIERHGITDAPNPVKPVFRYD